MEIAVANNVDMEAACEGVIACSTCHVIVEDQWIGKLAEPSEDEEENVEVLLQELEETSADTEENAGLRILGQLAKEIRHEQFHDRNYLLVKVDSAPL